MIWAFLIGVAVLLLGGFAALAAGRLGYDPLADPVQSQRDPGLPENFTASDVRSVRFDTSLRGYRMDQVDRVLDRLEERLSQLDAQLREQRGDAAPPPARPGERASDPDGAQPASPAGNAP